MSGNGQFVAKISKVKTRSKGEKNYYAYRINIPNHIVDELELKKDDYIFVKSSMKAKWYHLFKWHEEPKAWYMLPAKLQQEIQSSGMTTIPDTNIDIPNRSITWQDSNVLPVLSYIIRGVENVGKNLNISGVTNMNIPTLEKRRSFSSGLQPFFTSS